MRILVTGGCGFIGSHIVEYHLKKGDTVYTVDNLSTGSENNIRTFQVHPNFKFYKADVVTWDRMDEVVAKVDRIYHLSAVVGNLRVIKEPIDVILSNITGCQRLFTSIVNNGNKPRVILASTSCVYGNGTQVLMREEDDLIIEDPSHLHSNYSISKLCDEIIGLSYDQMRDIPTTVVRFFNTIGPRQTGSYGFVVPRFIEQACLGIPMTLYGDGSQSRSFCDVHDVVNMLDIIAGNIDTRAQIMNVGLDREVTIKELAEMIRKRANSDSELVYVPYKKVYGTEFIDIMHRKPDLTKLYRLTQYKHQWTLEDTVDKLIQACPHNHSRKPKSARFSR